MSALRKGKRRGKAPSRKATRGRGPDVDMEPWFDLFRSGLPLLPPNATVRQKWLAMVAFGGFIQEAGVAPGEYPTVEFKAR